MDESGLIKFERVAEFDPFLEKYVKCCYPKTGWEGLHSPNHFQLIRKIVEERPTHRAALARLCLTDLPETVQGLLEGQFDGLFSPRRKRFIVSCVRKRLEYYNRTITI